MELKKEVNTFTNGVCCVFQKGEEFFYADCSPVPFIGPETMIFPCDKDGNVTSWTEVYCDRTLKSLDDCVKEFLNE